MFSINQKSAKNCTTTFSYLHSTMFSINLDSIPEGYDAEKIYIPLCFLLIEQAGVRFSNEDLYLHSTMFSINHAGLGLDIAVVIYLHSTMFSINLAFAVANDVGCVYLHSTMFSINRNASIPVHAGLGHLHSTMFSINLSFGSASNALRFIFTFHYVFY